MNALDLLLGTVMLASGVVLMAEAVTEMPTATIVYGACFTTLLGLVGWLVRQLIDIQREIVTVQKTTQEELIMIRRSVECSNSAIHETTRVLMGMYHDYQPLRLPPVSAPSAAEHP